jgi:hypothetical protein
MPSFFILELSVVRLRPRRSAAPPGPPMMPLASRSARRMVRARRPAVWDCGCCLVFFLFLHGFELGERHVQHRPAREDHGALQKILELANVARPLPRDQSIHRFRRDGFDGLAHAAGVARDKMAHQDGNVGGAVAQRRRKDRKNLEAVKEVAAEFLFRDHFGQIAIGGGDEAHVDGDGPRAAQALDLALLQSAQQFRLQVERQLAHLVEEERALVRQLQRPILRAMAPVNAPFSWPKSSLSSRPAGMAAQFSLIKVRSLRGLRRWMARASSSLPVPVSPWMSTVASVGATVSISRSTLRRPVLSPTMSSKRCSRLISSSRYLLFLGQAVAQFGDLLKGQALLTAMATCPATWPSISASCCENASPGGWPPSWSPRVLSRCMSGTQTPDCMPIR